jgi:hypothetical protein
MMEVKAQAAQARFVTMEGASANGNPHRGMSP